MTTPHSHLRTLEEIERDCIPGLVKVLQTEGVEGVRYALWDMTGWHAEYDPCVWRSQATEEQKRRGWEVWVRMDKIIAKVLHEAPRRPARRRLRFAPRRSHLPPVRGRCYALHGGRRVTSKETAYDPTTIP